MTTELGNTTPSDLGILRGSKGYREALKDRANWQARRPSHSDWCGYDGPDGWGEWCGRKLHSEHTEWRRRPAAGSALPDYRPCSRSEAEANPGESQYHVKYKRTDKWYDWSSCTAMILGVNTLDYEFQTRARPADEPKVEAPGTIITWQRAQERVDAGLAVETQVLETGEWTSMAGGHQPKHYSGYRYRIPLTGPAAPPAPVKLPARTIPESELVGVDDAQLEPVAEMTAEQATEWLHSGGTALAVADKFGNVWRHHRGFIRDPNGSTYSSLMPSDAPFAKLLPATQSQVALAQQLKERTDEANELARSCESLRRELRDMTETRDKAVAERDKYRDNVGRLRGVMYALRGEMVDIDEVLKFTADETVGKGQG